MKIFSYSLLALILLILPFSGAGYAQENGRSLSDNPTQLKKYVVDETATLTKAQTDALLKKLQDFDKQTSTQIVVYMISTLDGEAIEEAAVRIAEKNKIGQKGKDNGILLLIAKNDRKMRIEVGYGLEGALTDAQSASIIRNEITPEFRSDNYYGGIDKGVDAIIAATKGEYKGDEEDNSDNPGAGGCCFGLPIFIVVIFVFIFFSIFMSIIQRIFGFGKSITSGGKRSSNTPWFWGGGGGGWSGGSGSSGGFGGFSGGGGSFGGGGASGSW